MCLPVGTIPGAQDACFSPQFPAKLPGPAVPSQAWCSGAGDIPRPGVLVGSPGVGREGRRPAVWALPRAGQGHQDSLQPPQGGSRGPRAGGRMGTGLRAGLTRQPWGRGRSWKRHAVPHLRVPGTEGRDSAVWLVAPRTLTGWQPWVAELHVSLPWCCPTGPLYCPRPPLRGTPPQAECAGVSTAEASLSPVAATRGQH